MKVIIAWDGDHIGREVGRASLADDVDGLRRISQAIDLGNNVWKSWVIMNGGSVISMGGDEGRAEIPADKLAELPKLRNQYAQAVSASVSVGVGTKLSEADRALLVAKLRGGDRIVLYTQDIEPEIEAAEKQKTTTSEAEKLSDEYLGKADPGQGPESPAAAQPTAAGFQGAAAPIDPGNDQQDEGPAPAPDAGAAQDMGAQPQAAPTGDPGPNLEDQFHQAADDQQKKDSGDPEAAASSDDQLKTQVVEILKQLKEQAPILEQIKQSAPDTYKAVMGMAQAVIAMARKLNGDPADQTGAKEVQDRASSDAQVQVPLPPEDGDGEKKDKDDTKKSEGKFDCDSFGHCWGTGAASGFCLLCGKGEKEIEELEKASLNPNAGAPAAHHHLNLPVGSKIDPTTAGTARAGRIKVLHQESQKQGWIQARAGQVLSQDGHPISARNPNGK
jgi:hypothetical protein